MQGKVVVISGATSGIGLAAAERLAALGARLVLIGRDKERGEAALARLREITPNVSHSIYYGNLSRLAETKEVAAKISAAESHIDVLINNAGGIFGSRKVTEDGLELTFATNHMGYFGLTLGLRKRLLASAPARVINTASGSHKGLRDRFSRSQPGTEIDSKSRNGALLDFNDLQSANEYNGYKVYCRSKLCNILFTRELARQFNGARVTVNCLHPGFVASRFGDEGGRRLALMFRMLKVFGIPPEKGADTIVYLATAEEVANTTGCYFYKRHIATPSVEACNDTLARRLWTESVRLAGMKA